MGQDTNLVAESVATNLLYGGAGASISVATASGTTIPVVNRVVRVSATAATTSGSCTLATGTLDGQTVMLINESANAIVISGNILNGAETVSATRAAQFVYSTLDTKWAKCV